MDMTMQMLCFEPIPSAKHMSRGQYAANDSGYSEEKLFFP